jgi:hypothetical protein
MYCAFRAKKKRYIIRILTVLYEFAISSPNAIVTYLTTSSDGVIKVPNVFIIGGFGGI